MRGHRELPVFIEKDKTHEREKTQRKLLFVLLPSHGQLGAMLLRERLERLTFAARLPRAFQLKAGLMLAATRLAARTAWRRGREFNPTGFYHCYCLFLAHVLSPFSF
jgi:hypothetical protein